MAKKPIDSFVHALVSIKSMISNLKLLSNVIAFDPTSNLIYMAPLNDMHDCFAIMHNSDLIDASKKFQFHIINTVEAVAFNKALKKTKTTCEIKDDKSLFFLTEGYEETLSMLSLSDYKDITKIYAKLFKDEALTKECLNAIYGQSHIWKDLSSDDMERIRNNELVITNSTSDDIIYISKSIFGNIKKTIGISHTVVQENEGDEVVLFKQSEDGYDIYHIIRFLTDM